MRVENWNGYPIRFVELQGEWWAVASDVAKALGYKKPENAVSAHVSKEDKTTTLIQGTGSNYKSKSVVISEFGIYDLVFSSKMKEAKQFKRWIFDVIKQLRQSTGLEGFQVFRMLDKEHQKRTMIELQKAFVKVSSKDFIKANTIANKAVSNEFGYPKLVKKGDMTPEMLKRRQPILEDTVILMSAKEKFDLPISVSQEVYKKVEKQ